VLLPTVDVISAIGVIFNAATATPAAATVTSYKGMNRRGAGRGGPGVRTPPATARTTCEIRLNPRTVFRGEGGGSAITLFKTYILQSVDVFNIRNSAA